MNSDDWLPEGFSLRRIDTNGTRLSLAVGGSGPVLVLLHGWPQTSRAWARVMPDLARNHTVVVPDLRGTGDSDRPDSGYAKTHQADDIRGILTALDLTGPVAVAGHADHVRGAVAPTGHFVAEEDPGWFTDAVTAFLV
ncbi:alpha/beta fold hydrolase [Streptomyces sp. FR-108]|uniref:alpha/beta fold hydrolase n=1 Tax=Streptomyces sp. FR-108 TaxID=3416665 RepID=UPI003CECB052